MTYLIYYAMYHKIYLFIYSIGQFIIYSIDQPKKKINNKKLKHYLGNSSSTYYVCNKIILQFSAYKFKLLAAQSKALISLTKM